MLVAGILVFWLVPWVARFAPPVFNDLFFEGDAKTPEETGTMANPWLCFWILVAECGYYWPTVLCGVSVKG
jgi:hypothetical protein